MAGEKKKNVTLRLLAHVNLDDGTDGRFQVVSLRLWSVEDLYRMGTTGNTHQRSVVKVLLAEETDTNKSSQHKLIKNIDVCIIYPNNVLNFHHNFQFKLTRKLFDKATNLKEHSKK